MGDGATRRSLIRSPATPTERAANARPSNDDVSGAEGNRTPDPFHAMEVLYQLSYSPEERTRYQRGSRLPGPIRSPDNDRPGPHRTRRTRVPVQRHPRQRDRGEVAG